MTFSHDAIAAILKSIINRTKDDFINYTTLDKRQHQETSQAILWSSNIYKWAWNDWISELCIQNTMQNHTGMQSWLAKKYKLFRNWNFQLQNWHLLSNLGQNCASFIYFQTILLLKIFKFLALDDKFYVFWFISLIITCSFFMLH